jgi:hypothetical protein
LGARNWFILASAFLMCSGFSNDSAGRACVQQQGERGTGYDVDRTKIKDAYSPNGRRMLQDGHRVYEVEVPPLSKSKRSKPVTCTMTMANGLWQAAGPGVYDRNPFAPGNNPFNSDPKRESDPFTAREKPGTGSR